MKNDITLMAIVLLLLLSGSASTSAQGIPGHAESPSPRGGTVLGAPLLPGKNDAERWSLVRAKEKHFVGMTKDKLVKLFGKPAYGEDKRELLYQVTEWKKKPNAGDVLFQELSLRLDESETVRSFAVRPVHFN